MMSMERRHKLIRRLTAIGSYLLVAWVMFAGLEIHSLTLYARHWSGAQQNLLMVEKVFGDLKDMESGQRGYLITGEQEYLAQFNAGSAALEYDFRVLVEYLNADSQQRKTLAELTTVINAKNAEMAKAVTAYKEHGFEAAQLIVRTNKGYQQMAHIRFLVDVIKAREQASLKQTAGLSFQ